MSSSPPFSPSCIRSRLLPQSPTAARSMASSGGRGTPRSPSSPSSVRRRPILSKALALADAASWYCVLLLLSLILLSSLREAEGDKVFSSSSSGGSSLGRVTGGKFLSGAVGKPCDEIYVVGEGETLHTISDKCKDPFIVERNPHIHDPDDVFPGLVIKIVPLSPGQY